MSRRSKADWMALIQEFEQSGQSQAQFCSQYRINPKYFSKRRRDLLLDSEQTSGFIAVKRSAATASPAAMRLSFGQVQLELPAGVDVRWLSGLLLALSV